MRRLPSVLGGLVHLPLVQGRTRREEGKPRMAGNRGDQGCGSGLDPEGRPNVTSPPAAPIQISADDGVEIKMDRRLYDHAPSVRSGTLPSLIAFSIRWLVTYPSGNCNSPSGVTFVPFGWY